jgi:DNA (cytosine-5)-methyltransferase 1
MRQVRAGDGGGAVRLLDLFCGAGGASRGYADAGFEVVGVDNRPQPRYPFTFIQADALEYLATADLSGFDAVHASPPCQDHSPARSVAGEHGTGWLLGATRNDLAAIGLPYVIENVEAAAMPGSLVLCGTEFGLTHGDQWLRRHRRFESSVFLLGAGGCQCSRPTSPTGVYGDLSLNDRRVRHSKRGDVMLRAGVATARALLGCPWMTGAELSQAIPPAYTRFIGEQLADHIRTAVTA